ncbi:response regulator [Cyclobacterium qasimii]|uniref:Two-component response regulator yhcZ n=2 Tax=Cyclobacterium qasimii TaxID=1350429 RepID=S7WYD6_9BACT|nr:response regulator transcription factor [Cyclobacterium qasimii]EPR71779.1 Two-component response regulator yhcZ [Cyclobacterium qasimii M12-11B]GEO22171.1 DNA-binding response regulator [Cyclobacterium qasimii]
MIKIGLVEDNAQLGQDIRDKLALGGEVTIVWEERDGSSALKAMQLEALPDVVLMDISMPGMDGIEATRLAKEKYPSLKILMLTVMDDEKKLFEALKAGASGYLLKEIRPHLLKNAIDEVLEGSLPLSPSLASMALNYLKGKPKAQESLSPEMGKLSKREQEVLQWLKKGMSVRQIGEQLFISDKTVRKHLEHIYEKLQVHSGKEAIAKGFER